ncbi:MAG: (Fe-S)-binding protein [Dehalococcoidia bacterium]|nr:(Fe-S)-binding protein [Dehalococcoidia bacterium]
MDASAHVGFLLPDGASGLGVVPAVDDSSTRKCIPLAVGAGVPVAPQRRWATVGLFVPRHVSVLRPGEHRFAEQVLRALGDEVELIEGRCCGQPAYNSGFHAEAHDVGRLAPREAHARRRPSSRALRLRVRRRSSTGPAGPRSPTTAVGRAPSCACRTLPPLRRATRRPDHPERAPGSSGWQGVATYHERPATGRRELGLTNTVIDLLASVQGLELRRLEREGECCGFGGTFSVKLPEVSRVMGQQKLKDVRATGAKVVVSGDLSCLAHLEGLGSGTATTMEAGAGRNSLRRPA